MRLTTILFSLTALTVLGAACDTDAPPEAARDQADETDDVPPFYECSLTATEAGEKTHVEFSFVAGCEPGPNGFCSVEIATPASPDNDLQLLFPTSARNVIVQVTLFDTKMVSMQVRAASFDGTVLAAGRADAEVGVGRFSGGVLIPRTEGGKPDLYLAACEAKP